MNYDQKLKELYDARDALAKATDAKRKAYSEFITSIGYVDLLDEVEHYGNIVDALEAEIKGVAQVGGEKHPHPAVEVKEFTVYDYVEQDAIDYCKTAAPVALKFSLDSKLWKSIMERTVLPFVKKRTEKRAQIASDLSMFFGGEK